MSVIAVFIALGGSSYAISKLPKNTVGTKQLKKNAVTTAKLKNEAVTAGKVRKGTLTGTQIDTSTLGTVPTATRAATAGQADSAGVANTLQGMGANAFVQGRGAQAAERRDLEKGQTEVTLIAIPGVAEVRVGCKPTAAFRLDLINVSGAAVDYSYELTWPFENTETFLGVIEAGTNSGIETINPGRVAWQVATRSNPPSIATINVSFGGTGGPTACQFYANAEWGT